LLIDFLDEVEFCSVDVLGDDDEFCSVDVLGDDDEF
jgi:hypothetical protein